jgi:hypothetical protein
MADELPETEIEDDAEQLLEIQTRYEAARDHALEWRKMARIDFAYYAGDQWAEDDRQKLMEQQRVPVTFNRTGPLVDAIIGYETNNRQETRYIPRTEGDAKINEALTEAGKFFRDQCDAEFEESDAFRDMVICGMGWTNDRLDDTYNPEYDLIRDRTDPFEMLWDPSSRKPNLVDRRYDFRKKWMAKDEAKGIFPDWGGEYLHVDWLSDDFDTDGDTARINPRMRYKTGVIENSAVRDVPVLEYQYCEYKTMHVVVNPSSGEQLELDDEQWEELDEETRNAAEAGTIPHTTKRLTEWKRCFLIGGEIVKKDMPYPKGSTYHCMTGKRDRNKSQWFGIVKALRDPQMWSNKWLSQIMHLINTSAKPGYDIEEGAVKDVAKFESRAARPGAVNAFTDGALQKGRVQRREAVGMPPDLANLMQYANDAMSDVSGVNQELLGMADRDQAGVLEYQRKQSAVTLLAPLFDSLRRYRKVAGRCWLYFMQHYMTDGRIVRITQDKQDGMPGKQEVAVPFTDQFFDESTSEYDVIVDQSSSAPNLKEEAWLALQPLLPLVAERLGPEEFMTILEYSPMPVSFTEKMKMHAAEKAKQPPPPDPEMVKIEAMQKAKQAELQLKQQEAQVDAQLEQQKAEVQLRLEGQKGQAQIQLEREKAAAQLQLEQQKAIANFELQKQKNAMDYQHEEMRVGLEMRRSEQETKIKADGERAKVMGSALGRSTAELKDVFGHGELAKAIETMAEAIATMAQSNQQSNQMTAEAIATMGSEIKDGLSRPKTLVRGPDGRAIGVQ